jgi:hypothetical protein
MKRIYLDWNVFSSLKSIPELTNEEEKECYSLLLEYFAATRSNFIIPYSNAHLNDLKKNHKKGLHSRVQDALNFISLISADVCLCQYWGNETAIFHSRTPVDFFNEMQDEEEVGFESVSAMYSRMKEYGGDSQVDFLEKLKDVPIEFDISSLQQNPITSQMFKRTIEHKTKWAFMDDIVHMLNELRTNPILYNQVKELYSSTFPLDKEVYNTPNVIDYLDTSMAKTPLNKGFTELYRDNNRNNVSDNINYSKFIGYYMLLDLIGFKSEKLSDKNLYDNLFNDALHCFYAAHCDYFISNDKSCRKKTAAVYIHEGVTTEVWSPREFVDRYGQHEN